MMFNKARLRLTAWYLLIIMFISVSFSIVIYSFSTAEIERFEMMQRTRIERHLLEGDIPNGLPRPLVIPSPELLNEVRQRVLFALLLANGAIFLTSGGLGYLLAGRTLRPIAEMIEEQNRFISDASHELKTPLTSLKSAFEVFLRGQNSNLVEAKTVISESILEVDKLHRLSESLLQLARYQKLPKQQKIETLNLSEAVKEAINTLLPLAKSKQITFSLNLKNGTIYGDKYALRDLATIFIDNAIKYSHESGEIAIKTNIEGKNVIFSVKDSGPGIAEDDLPHIFDRFYRADTAREKNDHDGYGLGLSIAKEIINLHNGTINVESKEGKGTKFIVKFPLVS